MSLTNDLFSRLLNYMKAKKGWSQSGSLIAGQHAAISLQCEFVEAGNYTLQFNVQGRDLTNALSQRRTEAEITWSVEGNSVTRRVDVINGTSITGEAQAVSVKVRDTTPVAGAGEYIVSVQVAKGSRPSVQQPPYLTGPAVVIAAADTTPVDVPIPLDAGVIAVSIVMFPVFIGSAYPTNPYDYEAVHFRGGSSGAKAYSPLLLQNVMVPIASGTTKLQILQSAAGIDMRYYITWGIDG